MRPVVCILAAGRGTRMGGICASINKALLPVGSKAAISRIIERFPANTEFVVAVGHLGQLVRDHLALAHPKAKITFVEVDRIDGKGSGPGYSLRCCSRFLRRPFYFVSCDTLWKGKLNLARKGNWFGVSRVPNAESAQYCNFEIKKGRIVGIRDKQRVSGSACKAFVGLCHVENHATFWRGLADGKNVAGELQVSSGIEALVRHHQPGPLAVDVNWIDIGTLENYRKALSRYERFDFSKSSEFFYVTGGRTIKFFADAENARKRVRRAGLNRRVFPKIVAFREHCFAYEFVTGQTLYTRCNERIFSGLLEWLDKNLWVRAKVEPGEMQKLCRSFYEEKTRGRLKDYHQRYGVRNAVRSVNGRKLPPLEKLLRAVPWNELRQGVPAFIHGDLQFDNILYDTKRAKFTLLDWRQDFAGRLDVGDLYYDLAKLYGGLLLDYSAIKKNNFSYVERGKEVRLRVPRPKGSERYLEMLTAFAVANELDLRRLRILVSLIYLNMSPLHHHPFDKLLYSLGRFLLAEEVL